MRRFALALTLAASAASGTAYASAQSADEAREIYSGYQRAVAAAETCRDVSLDQPQHYAISQAMDSNINYSMGAERLHLLVNAKEGVRAYVRRYGCDNAQVAEWLTLYDKDLAPALVQ